jgi:hypothetical protein
MKYRDLFELFQYDQKAKQYYDELPDYVREQIAARAAWVNSPESLQGYAENLLRGDD